MTEIPKEEMTPTLLAMAERMAAFNARTDVEGMSVLRKHIEMEAVAFGPSIVRDFMLKFGKDFPIGPDTFSGPRGTPKECYRNAAMLAIEDPTLTYVEGKVAAIIPIDHAWCVDADGVVVDPTLNNDDGRVTGYYGVAFPTPYLKRAIFKNKVFGLLDFFYAGKTAPKLYELGLEAGMAWLMDAPIKKKRKKKAA